MISTDFRQEILDGRSISMRNVNVVSWVNRNFIMPADQELDEKFLYYAGRSESWLRQGK